MNGAAGESEPGGAPAPAVRDLLKGQLGWIRHPARTMALLDDGAESDPGSIEAWATRLVRSRLRPLVDGLCGSADEADLTMRVRALSGLGPGLTPTGDDLLVGLAAVCHRLVELGCWPRARRDAFTCALDGIGETGTTAVARAMVSQAAAGCLPAELDRFVTLLGDGAADRAQIRTAVARLAAVGAHSGSDMLAGAVALFARACREGESG